MCSWGMPFWSRSYGIFVFFRLAGLALGVQSPDRVSSNVYYNTIQYNTTIQNNLYRQPPFCHCAPPSLRIVGHFSLVFCSSRFLFFPLSLQILLSCPSGSSVLVSIPHSIPGLQFSAASSAAGTPTGLRVAPRLDLVCLRPTTHGAHTHDVFVPPIYEALDLLPFSPNFLPALEGN